MIDIIIKDENNELITETTLTEILKRNNLNDKGIEALFKIMNITEISIKCKTTMH